MKWERIEPSDSAWWTRTLEKATEIQQAIDAYGKNLWTAILFDEEGTVNIERVLEIQGSTLYFVSRGLSTQIGVSKIQSLTADAKARKQMQELPDAVSRDRFLSEWSAQGTLKLKPGWSD